LLLLIPAERAEILRAKLLGSILRTGLLGCGLVLVLLLGIMVGALYPWTCLLWMLGIAGVLFLVANTGLCLSLLCRSTGWARVTMSLVILVLLSTPWQFAVAPGSVSPWLDDVSNASNPTWAWWILGAASPEQVATAMAEFPEAFRRQMYAFLLVDVLMVWLAWMLWYIARRRFSEARFEPFRRR